MRVKILPLAVLVAMSSCVVVLGQTVGSRAGQQGTAANGRTQGLQQTGQLSSDAAISRDSSQFVGGNNGGSFLSQSGNTVGSAGGGFGGFSSGGLNTLGTASLGAGLGRGFGGGGFGGGGFGQQGGLGGQQFGATATATPGLARVPFRLSLQLQRVAQQVAPSRTANRFANRLQKIPGLSGMANLTITMEGRTAVLQGVVDSAHQRDLIAGLAGLEPGISSIRNELIVRPMAQ